MKTLLCGLLGFGLFAADRRLTETPNTDTVFAMPAYTTRADWQARREALRKQILVASGMYPLPAQRGVPRALVFGKLERKGYTVEKVLLETLPGYWLGGNLYRPAEAGKHPAVLNPHGHWNYGRLEHQPLYSGPTLGANLARRGFVTFAYDMVGYNDTTQTPHQFGQTKEEMAWSFGPFQLQTWNSLRALDWLVALPDVDAEKIAMTGASGGGTQTFALAAIDERVKVAAPVNMVSFIMQGGCVCENAPGLRVKANNVEIAAMMAPRPMLMVSATGDWTRNTLEKEFPAVRGIYELLGAQGQVEAVRFESPHNYHRESREAVYRFFVKHFYPGKESGAESGAGVEAIGDMLALYGRGVPEGSKSLTGVFAEWKKLIPPPSTAAEARDRLQSALQVEWPAAVQASAAFLSRGAGDEVPFRGQRGTVLAVGGDGRNGFAIDPFLTAAGSSRDESHRHFLTFNRSADAERVQDVLTGLKYLGAAEPEVRAGGAAYWWALYAAAVAPVKVKLTPVMGGGSGEFFVPGLERAGGVAAARLALR